MGAIKSRFCHDLATEMKTADTRLAVGLKAPGLYLGGILIVFLLFLLFPVAGMSQQAGSTNTYDDLLILFKGWRKFEHPPLLDGAPDYTLETTPGTKDLPGPLDVV